ncbi:MAG: lytic transglycosylase domain-containing protein, partial [Leptospira sp.]|nr:lytic transglycosylase domain-containing protein [Leptospira sp.]
IYFNMLSELRTPVYVRELIIKDLRSYFGHDFHDNLNEKDLALVLDVIGKSESKKIFNRGLIDFRRKFDNPVMVRNISRLLIRYQPERLFAFLSANQDTIASNPAFSVNFAEELIQISETGIAEKIIGEFGKNSDQASFHRIYARIYKKNRQEGKYFDSLLKYLAEVPYDLGFQDKLIDFLAGSTGRGLNFSRREYWIRAMEAIPSLPVKGRLIYWYLRFLKNTGDKTALQKLLSEYYQHCPGSYYIKTIRQEFSPEISELKLPANPTSGKENLVQFLSITGARPEEMEKIRGKNLSFAYYDTAFDLGVRLSNAQSKVKNHELLQLAAEYLRIGEESNAQYLVNQYSGQKGLNEEEKQELLVGLGDITRNAYLSLFNTRLLMRKYKIPDDPLLLPQTITSRLYPRPHRSVVSKNSKSFGVEEDIVYAIMRQESFFREAAISSSNAKGLMQVMPSTGKFLAKSLHVNDYSLHDPEVSIKLGTKFLSDLLQMNSNDLRWASIAYNGGPGNLRKWKRNHYQGDFNHFLEEIPSKESRDYCRITLSNYYNYRLLRSFYNQ